MTIIIDGDQNPVFSQKWHGGNMSVFKYRARTNLGEVVIGELAAVSEEELEQMLAERGLLLIEAKSAVTARLPQIWQRPVEPAAILAFIREFNTLRGAGIPVSQTLGMLSLRPEQPKLSAAVQAMHQGILKGQSLADVGAAQQHIFDPLFSVTLRVGVQTGKLEQALGRYCDFLVLRHELRRKLRKALAYPIFLLGLLAVVLAGLFLFVLPRFADLYAEFGGELPFATRILMSAVNAAPLAIIVFVGLTVLSIFSFRRWVSHKTGRRQFDGFKLSIPIIGPVLKNMAQIQLCYLLSMLLEAGVSVREALGFAADSAGNTVFSDALGRMAAAVSSGKSVTDAFEKERILPDTSLSLIKAGEASGSLARMLGEISKLHKQSLEDRLARVLALIEPSMLLLVGLVLGTVIIVVYLPIFGIADVIQ